MHYLRETSEILGKPLNHDDSVNDRAVGSKLSNASQTTAKLWKETFGEDFRSSGKLARDKTCSKATNCGKCYVIGFICLLLLLLFMSSSSSKIFT